MTAQIIPFRPRAKPEPVMLPLLTGYLIGLAIVGLMVTMMLDGFAGLGKR